MAWKAGQSAQTYFSPLAPPTGKIWLARETKVTGGSFTKIWKDTVDLLVKGTAHTRMKVIGGKTTVKTSATSDIGRLTKSLKEDEDE